ncbi:multiple sugar transport system permease protein [Labrys wisconsinensis]|uniref:sn-glycerol-3-phosphate transport system permease protein UgpE n=2 Tax=Labrys wisconsinensis TaxID=425677 RepID=A0ABU0J180_9HYPH|nr:carbohydrate ABC transporter permease [Labrys wisconsinensis]MDQ0468020.1 multiple sugar transport system permease protein [Labrys wisconsinensis]
MAPANPLPRLTRSIGANAVLLGLAGLVLLPYAWMALTAMRAPSEIFSDPFGLPHDPGILVDNIRRAFAAVPMARFLLNGLVVTAGLLMLQLAVAVPCAYALAKLRFAGKSALFALIVAALCVPIQVPMLPIYIVLASLKALDSYFALIFPFVLSPFAIFLLRQQFRAFPDEIIQAARLDGFSEVEIMLRLVVPSARPAIAAFAVFSITAHWNDLYWPLIVVSSETMATPPLGLMFFRDGDLGTDYGPLMAGAILIVAPVMLVFLLAQRQFIRGLTMTGLR